MIRSTDPTASARWTVWIRSNSSATSLSFAERTAAVISARRARAVPVVGARRLPHPLAGFAHLGVLLGACFDVASEHRGSSRRAADHRRERALHGGVLQPFVKSF